MGLVHPHKLRAAFITAALDAGVPLRDVQLAARHADPRTTTIYDRRRKNFDRHAAYASSPSWPEGRPKRPLRADTVTGRLQSGVLVSANRYQRLSQPLRCSRRKRSTASFAAPLITR